LNAIFTRVVIAEPAEGGGLWVLGLSLSFFTKKAEGRGQKAKGKKGKKNFSRGCYCPREKEKSLCA
jgi:hypothetical protein